MVNNEIEDICRLTPMQTGMLFHWIYDKQSTVYFLQQTYRIKGEVDVDICRACLDSLSHKFDVLRTAFVFEELDEPLQVVLRNRKIDFIIKTAEHEGCLEALKNEDRQRGFDLLTDALMRVTLVSFPEGYALIWSFHHIILDGWSIAIIISDFLSQYQQRKKNILIPEYHHVPYKTFLKWLENRDHAADASFWKEYLSGYDTVADVPGKRTDASGPSSFKSIRTTLSPLLKRKIEALALHTNTTVNLVLQSAWGILLTKYNNCRDVVFGQVVSGRPYELEGVESIVGLFVNTVPVRICFNPGDTFADVLQQRSQSAHLLYNHQHTALTDIQAQSSLKQQLFTHLWTFENYPSENMTEEGTGFEVTESTRFEQTSFDLTIMLLHEKELSMQFDYNLSRYSPLMMASVCKHFLKILETIGENVKVPVDEITILGEEERLLITEQFNSTALPYDQDANIMRVFKQRAAAFPDKVALLFEDKKMTYEALDRASDCVASYLVSKGAGQNRIVALMADRSVEMVVWIYGILKSGAAYLPVNTKMPVSGVKYLLKDSNALLLVTQSPYDESLRGITEIVLLEDKPHLSFDAVHPAAGAGTADLMYVMYTSGSTGMPKGVMIEHGAVMNLLYGLNRQYPFSDDDIFLMKTPYYFDVSIPELFGFFIGGAGKIVIMGKEEEKDPYKILSTIQAYQVSHVNFVPSLFNAFADICMDGAITFPHLRYIFLAGEALTGESILQFHQQHKRVRLVNIYGPTECCVYASSYDLTDWMGGSVPIGRALDNVRMWIVDHCGQMQPVGVAGELCISGAGLARGYVNNEEQTSLRFGPNPVLGLDRVYRTGDLARWLPDGNIDFLGRIDRQLKIRGNRVEPGEIEHSLLGINGITDACVIMREGILCGYYSGSGAPGEAQVRATLATDLPDHMIPGALIKLTSFPLTGSGKKDVQSLPAPDMREGEGYVAPESDEEKAVVSVWSKVLGHEQVGVTANFFLLGGDSIKAIQVISRLRGLGYTVTMKDIFDHPVAGRLARQVQEKVSIISQEAVTGSAPLSPIQLHFFKEHGSSLYRGHYNQSVMLLNREGFDETVLRRALSSLLEHHDALRMVFREDSAGVHQEYGEAGRMDVLQEVHDLRSYPDSIDRMAAVCTLLQSKCDLLTGPLMRCALFRLTDGDRLLIVIHHLVVDGVSWRILFADLDALYQGETLPLKTAAYGDWVKSLYLYATRMHHTFSYWQQPEEVTVAPVPGWQAPLERRLAGFNRCHLMLDASVTRELLSAAHHAYGTETIELLLTGLLLALHSLGGEREQLLTLEGHGREEGLSELDLTRTVGWFTSMYPVLLVLPEEAGVGAAIKTVKEQLRQIPDRGAGYGVYRYLSTPVPSNPVCHPELLFNYLGQFATDLSGRSFTLAGESAGETRSEQLEQSHSLQFTVIAVGGHLELELMYNRESMKAHTANTLLDAYAAQLQLIAGHCRMQDKRSFTPSDFTCKTLSLAAVENICSNFAAADIYRLSGIQEGMLFHWLYAPASTVYFEQFSYRLKGKIDYDRMKWSFDQLIQKHESLRTIFLFNGLPYPVQVVLKQQAPDFTFIDLSKTPSQEGKRDQIQLYRDQDLKRGFLLDTGPLIRAALLQLSAEEYELVWSFHHIIMDGWCVNLLQADFQQFYEQYGREQEQIDHCIQYKTYISWLHRQDKNAGREFWQTYFNHYLPGSTRIISGYFNTPTNEYKQACQYFTINASDTTRLKLLARGMNVTPSVVIQSLWGVLLGKLGNSEDVVFGLVVSGRPPVIPGVESIIGLFINAIPLRIIFNPEMTWQQLFISVQHMSGEIALHQYASLSDIKSMLPVETDVMFDHALIFEDFAKPPGIGHVTTGFEMIAGEVYEQTNYDFDVSVRIAEEILFKFSYNEWLLTDSFLKELILNLSGLITQILEDPVQSIKHFQRPIEAAATNMFADMRF